MNVILKRLSYVALAAIGCLVITLAILTSTELGLRLILKALPGNITLENINGSLLKGWHAEKVHYETNELELFFGNVDIQWQIQDILQHNLHITNVKVSNASITVKQLSENKPNKSSQPMQLPQITLPFDIELDQFSIQKLKLINDKQAQYINQINVRATLIDNTLEITHLHISNDQGQINTTAMINLSSWNNIHITSHLHYQLSQTDLNATVSVTGNKDNFTVQAHSHERELLEISAAFKNLFLGKEHASISARWKVDFDSKLLTLLHAKGRVISEGSVEGQLLSPVIKGSLNLNNILHDDISIGSLHGIFHTTSYRTLSSSLNASDLSYGNFFVNHVNLDTTAHDTHQQLQLFIQANDTQSLKVSTNSNYDRNKKQWLGSITTTDLILSDDVHLKLKDKSHFSFSPTNSTIDKFCLENNKESLCSSVKATNTSASITTEINQLDLGFIHSWLDKVENIQGMINGKMSAQYQFDDGTITVTSNLNAKNTEISYQLNNQNHHINIPDISHSLSINNKGLNSSLKILLPNTQHIIAEFGLPKFQSLRAISQQDTVEGNLDISICDITFLTLFTDIFDQLNGEISSDLSVKGTLEKPEFSGGIRLINGHAEITPLGLDLSPITISIKPKDFYQLNYQALIEQGNQKLTIDGNTQFDLSSHLTKLNITSDNFTASNTHEYTIQIAPSFSLFITNHNASLSGKVKIISAQISPIDFSGTVTLPSDVVFVNNADKPIHHDSEFNLALNIDLDIQNTKFAYKGLTAQVKGALNLTKQPNSQIHSQGQVQIAKGKYQAYGQLLTIDDGGRLNFSGDPANPQLNIKATKEVPVSSSDITLPIYQKELIVGIHVTGTMLQPKISFFSVPAGLNAQDILSYLVFGFPQSQLTDTQSAAVWQVVGAMDIGDSSGSIGHLKQNLQHTLDLTQLGFGSSSEYNPETEEVESGTAFIIGKRLTDRLTLTYSMGIMIPINILYLRYMLSQHWAIQTDSSALGNGADIIYTISRD